MRRSRFASLALGAGMLAHAPPATLERIAREGIHRKALAGSTMFDERSPCAGSPRVLAGSIRGWQRYPNGREPQLHRVKPGESCLLSGSGLFGNTDCVASGAAETDGDDALSAEDRAVLLPLVHDRVTEAVLGDLADAQALFAQASSEHCRHRTVSLRDRTRTRVTPQYTSDDDRLVDFRTQVRGSSQPDSSDR